MPKKKEKFKRKKTKIGKEPSEFGEWLKENTTLSETLIKKYVFQINKMINEYGTDLDNIRRFIVAGERVYQRKYAVKYYLRWKNRSSDYDKLKDIASKIRILDRKYERVIDFEQFRGLINYLYNKDPRYMIILSIMWDTAMRISPVLDLKFKMFNKDDNGVYIRVVEKGKKVVKRYISDFVVKLIKNYYNIDVSKKIPNYISEIYLFRERKGKRWETKDKAYYRYWSQIKNHSRKFLGLGYGISFHWIRTSRAKELYEKSKDLLLVKSILGHSNITTTMRYIDEGKERSAEIIKKEKGKWEI